MRARRTIPAKPLVGVGLALCILAVGLWAVPAFGGASEAEEAQTLTVSINVPVNEIQDGQFCQAYGIASGGTPPYTFTWDGQFTDADAQNGPLGVNQIVSGFVSQFGDLSLEVEVEDSSTPEPLTGDDDVELTIGDYPYNPECEA